MSYSRFVFFADIASKVLVIYLYMYIYYLKIHSFLNMIYSQGSGSGSWAGFQDGCDTDT